MLMNLYILIYYTHEHAQKSNQFYYNEIIYTAVNNLFYLRRISFNKNIIIMNDDAVSFPMERAAIKEFRTLDNKKE